MTVQDQILAVLSAKKVALADLSTDDPRAAAARRCEGLFTGMVDALRSGVPNDRVRALAGVVWDLVGHQQVLVAVGLVETLTFMMTRLQGGIDQGLVLVPPQWPEMVEDDPIMQLGAVLYVGVQVVDFYNNRLLGDPTALARSHAYEADLLHALRGHLPSWVPNAYQRRTMEKFPDGLRSEGVVLYEIRGFTPAQGTA